LGQLHEHPKADALLSDGILDRFRFRFRSRLANPDTFQFLPWIAVSRNWAGFAGMPYVSSRVPGASPSIPELRY